MLNRRRGKVQTVQQTTAHLQELVVEVDGEGVPAVNYRLLCEDVFPGDLVELNTTAVDLGLGSGGAHFVISRIEGYQRAEAVLTEADCKREGHIMKLRYTPLQFATLCVEEENSPYHTLLSTADSLEEMPVMVASLHSLLAPICVVFHHHTQHRARLAYIMTDGAALPLGFSRLVASLKAQGLIDVTITIGHAFGGDLEAVNVYSGLLAARHVAKVDACLVAMGPGVVGTGTLFGTTALETAAIIDGVNALGGRAVAVPRVSFADQRPRHHGLSHHTLTALGRLCHTSCFVPFPRLLGDEARLLEEQVRVNLCRHNISWVDADQTLELLQEHRISVESMGRGPNDDPAFFRAGGAGGWLAAQLV
ncbi:MAG: DUF3866 family protein [Firmicutes bacterium]|nr:DUF3866 family protein [Bacillota bacterium]